MLPGCSLFAPDILVYREGDNERDASSEGSPWHPTPRATSLSQYAEKMTINAVTQEWQGRVLMAGGRFLYPQRSKGNTLVIEGISIPGVDFQDSVKTFDSFGIAL